MTYEDIREGDICPDCDGTGYMDGFTPYDWMKKHGLVNGSMSVDDLEDFEACATCDGHGMIFDEDYD